MEQAGMNITDLRLDLIRIDGETQARARIDLDAVAEYAEQMMEGVALPPAVVFRDGAEHWLADGFHRYHASRKIGAVSMPVELLAGTLHDAKLYAYAANKTHGLRRTNEDKRKAVLGMLALVPDWSDRAIAKHVGVSPTSVGSHRASLSNLDSETGTERTYTTKHGTTATMDTSGQKQAAKDRTTRATETASPVTPEQRAPGPVTTTEPDDDGPSAADMLDQMQDEVRAAEAKVAEFERVMLADDGKAEAAKLLRRIEQAERAKHDAMATAAQMQQRAEFYGKQLARCGKAVGVKDLDKVAPAVEAMARAAKRELA